MTLNNFPICAFAQTNRHLASTNPRAIYNARLKKLGNSSWAYVCQNCFDFFECEVGIDSGWKLEQPEDLTNKCVSSINSATKKGT